MRYIFIALAFLCSHLSVAYAGDPTSLFSNEDVFSITIVGPINELVRNMEETPEAYPAMLSVGENNAEAHDITISSRGKSRRKKETCKFPPLRIRFNEKPEIDSLFHKQRSLKLVTHCRKSTSFQQYTLLEYTAYKLFNEKTEASFRVRLANVSYVDEESQNEIANRMAFFIEDVDDVAKRIGMKKVKRNNVHRTHLDENAVVDFILFQYMIGNLDWSVLKGPSGDECCHNGKLIGASKEATRDLIPTPYDFDYSGFVNAPYALPPEGMGVHNTRQRRFRGFCYQNSETIIEAANYRQRRDEFYSIIESTPGLTQRTTKNAKKYLASFFDDIADDKSIQKNLLSHCRK